MSFFDKKKDETIFSNNPTFFKNLHQSSSFSFTRNKENPLFETNINKDSGNMNKEYENVRKNLKKVSNSLFFDNFSNEPPDSSEEQAPPLIPSRKQPDLPPNKPYFPFLNPPSHAPPSLYNQDDYVTENQNLSATLASVHKNYDSLSKPQKQALKTNVSQNISKSNEFLSGKKSMRNIMDKAPKPVPPTKPRTLKLDTLTNLPADKDFSNMSKSEICEKKSNTSAKSENNLLDMTDSFKDLKKSISSFFTKPNEPFKTYVKHDDQMVNNEFPPSTNKLNDNSTNSAFKSTIIKNNTTKSTTINDSNTKNTSFRENISKSINNIASKSIIKPAQNKPSAKPPRPTEGPKFNLNNQGPRSRALYDFDSDYPGDLSFKTGDVIYLDEEIDESWFRGHLKPTNKSGIFPANYIEVIEPLKKKKTETYSVWGSSNDYDSNNDDNYRDKDHFGDSINYGSSGTEDVYGNMGRYTPSDFYGNATSERLCATVLYDFEGIVENGEISLKQGDWLEQVEVATDDWMRGLKDNGEYGLFPSAYVEISTETQPKEVKPTKKEEVKQIDLKIKQVTTPIIATVTALYDFQGEQEGDLMFNTGDVIDVIKRINDDWLEGSFNGNIGLFPASFVSSF